MSDVIQIASKLTASQKYALTRIVERGNSPLGWSGSDLGVSAQSLNSLWPKGLVIGGHIYGAKKKSYRYTDLGEAVARFLQKAEG